MVNWFPFMVQMCYPAVPLRWQGKCLLTVCFMGGMVGVAPAIVKYLETGSLEEAAKLVTSSDLPDVDLRMVIEEKVG